MRFHHTTITTAIVAFVSLTFAQSEGNTVQPGAAAAAASSAGAYSCDPNVCKLANGCVCASKNPPNGLAPNDTPQFVTVTFDDSIQPQLYKTAKRMLNVTNPNGCSGRGTWYVSMQYTDFSLVQQWYSSGNEIADHTFSHVGTPSDQEITSCKEMLNTYGGVPNGKIQGFRAPFLNYTKETLNHLSKLGFLYDSSSSALQDDAYWPYTLDYGMANDCWTGICGAGQTKLPGLWEIPMYAVLDNISTPQLMDVYISGQPEDVTKWSLDTFNKHYNGGRQPFGIYVHPTHLTGYPGLPDPAPKLDGLVSLIKTLSEKPDVWFVTNQQLLQWMKNPVKASELGKQDYMRCEQPVIAKEICNGLDDDNNVNVDDGLLNSCNFGTTTFNTCFNCPSTAPTLDTPKPATAAQNGTAGFRYPLPNDCDTKWWDPIGNSCLCTSTECQYKDTAVPVNRTAGGNGVASNGSGSSSGANNIMNNQLENVFFITVTLVVSLLF
ncbi:hypothetical protein BD408DRAFT_424593 [Parasitella parasitica]|nr:hypothetical protein BD408DRAFT_424593 [Parasitella parasitica]